MALSPILFLAALATALLVFTQPESSSEGSEGGISDHAEALLTVIAAAFIQRLKHSYDFFMGKGENGGS